MAKVSTLSEFLVANPNHFPYSTSDALQLMTAIEQAAKQVHSDVNRAGLNAHILGAAGNTNVQGEDQQKLDVHANNCFIDAMRSQGLICGIGSEEDDHFLGADADLNPNGEYIVLMDPLDGSSNIDVNVSIGTIFSVFRRVSPKGAPVTEADFLQPGSAQVLAGYVLYGSSTMLVFTSGHGVNAFTLDPGLGLFCLSHAQLSAPQGGKIFSINEGNLLDMNPALQQYLHNCKTTKNSTGKPMSARYIGSLVADFHRNLLKGGIYIYPGTGKTPNGKLRLLYEANPLAFVIEQAGGLASNGTQRIMNIQPTELHQRVPLFIGSEQLVQEALDALKAVEAS